jgi:transposase
MKPIYRRCCGIDVHKKSISVCVLPPEGQQGMVKRETFRTFLRDLKRLRAWLQKCQVTEVAMESTGQYWRPVWNVLESFVRPVLLNPAHVKGLAGRKTDKRDAEWLARLQAREHLRGSFIPPVEIRELRELTRTRVHWLEDANRMKNRIAQVCEAGNIKISSVATDLFGVSGRRMLQALIENRHSPDWMAGHACGALRSKRDQLEMALDGTLSDHQRSLLARMMKQLTAQEADVADLTREIELRVTPWEETIGRLTQIPGMERISAWTTLAEIGTDMSVFEDARSLASWAAVCPGNRESGGKRMSGKTRKGNGYVRRILCQCAWAATRKKGSYFGVLYRRVRGRRGHQKAIMAVAHQMLTVIYHMLRDGTPYREPGEGYYDEKRKPEITRRLVKRLQRLGYQVTLEVAMTPEETLEASEAIPEASEAIPALPEALPTTRRRGRPCKCTERGLPCRHRAIPAERRATEINSQTIPSDPGVRPMSSH